MNSLMFYLEKNLIKREFKMQRYIDKVVVVILLSEILIIYILMWKNLYFLSMFT